MNVWAERLAHYIDLGYGEENRGSDDAADLCEAAEGGGQEGIGRLGHWGFNVKP